MGLNSSYDCFNRGPGRSISQKVSEKGNVLFSENLYFTIKTDPIRD